MEKTAALLVAKGFAATLEADPNDVIETDLPSDCEDPAKVADTIVHAIAAQ